MSNIFNIMDLVMSHHIKMVVYLSSGLLLVFGWHFATVFGVLGPTPQTRGEFFIRFGALVTIFIVASAVTAALIASKVGEDEVEPDEREKIIGLKAERNGSVTVMLSLFILMWLVFQPMSPMAIANSILAILCIGEIVKIVSGLIYLRKGI